jgi:hypothetical protein
MSDLRAGPREAAYASKTLVPHYYIKQQHIPADSDLTCVLLANSYQVTLSIFLKQIS